MNLFKILVVVALACMPSIALAKAEPATRNLPANTIFLRMEIGEKFIAPAMNMRNGVAMNLQLRCGDTVLYIPQNLAPARPYAITCFVSEGKPSIRLGTDLSHGSDL